MGTVALPEARRLNQRVKFNMIAAMTAIWYRTDYRAIVAGTLHNLTGSFNPSLRGGGVSVWRLVRSGQRASLNWMRISSCRISLSAGDVDSRRQMS
jgi:hypothetical protein